MLRSFKRGGNSGKVLDFTPTCFGIKSFHITFLTLYQRSADIDFQEILYPDNTGSHLPKLIAGTDESGNGNDSRINKQLAYFGYATDVFHTILCRKAQIIIDATTNIIPVQYTAEQTTFM